MVKREEKGEEIKDKNDSILFSFSLIEEGRDLW